MGVKVITPADLDVLIPVADLRGQCESIAADDTKLIGYRAAAHGHAQHYTGRAIGEQTLELALDEFPAAAVELPRGSVQSISSIKYLDEAGVEQTLSNALYTLDNYNDLQCWAVPAVGADWPATMTAANAVKVQYVAGVMEADKAGAVRSAMLLMVAHLYANREATAPTEVQELPLGVESLLNTVKVWSF